MHTKRRAAPPHLPHTTASFRFKICRWLGRPSGRIIVLPNAHGARRLLRYVLFSAHEAHGCLAGVLRRNTLMFASTRDPRLLPSDRRTTQDDSRRTLRAPAVTHASAQTRGTTYGGVMQERRKFRCNASTTKNLFPGEFLPFPPP